MATLSIYNDGEYFDNNPSWHQEDSSWKANEIAKILGRNKIIPQSVVEVGCGAGVILIELSKMNQFVGTKFNGYDPSEGAIALTVPLANAQVAFKCADYFATPLKKRPDLILAIDVVEHVPDYWGFLSNCRSHAEYKIYHIPLDVHLSSVLRGTLTDGRKSVGHLHYFTQETALSTLADTGHTIIDYHLTSGALDLASKRRSMRLNLSNIPRRLLAVISKRWAARVLGGFSLMVLTQ
ncbi:MAG: class I SAM-dependent methyltransferase [Aestuariivirga sp.]